MRELDEFTRLLDRPEGDFGAARTWALQLADARKRVRSALLALEPFTPFSSPAADDLILAIDEAVNKSAECLKRNSSAKVSTRRLRDARIWWINRESIYEESEILGIAFGLETSPLDALNEFRADWVLQQFAYEYTELGLRVIRHLNSLGVPEVTDILAGVSIIGALLNCEDPILAYVSMDSFVSSLLNAPAELAESVRGHLSSIEHALRRSRTLSGRVTAIAASTEEDLETRAMSLVEIYKRIVEGPFRQYGWALYCLRHGEYGRAPTLTNLRERLIADKGFLATVADQAIVVSLRNSEAHETLVWDGIDEVFVTECERVTLARVVIGIVVGDSFSRGCEAAAAVAGAYILESDINHLPAPDEAGRMPTWRRVRAYFGSNHLRLMGDHMNARDARLCVERLDHGDINPCFQALLTAHRLLPRIETFSVRTPSDVDAAIIVSANALEATMPIWKYAVWNLDRMPLATFLPANLDARRRIETANIAVRSVVWIAIDDALDAINGTPEHWNESVLQLLDVRLGVVVGGG